MFQKTTSIVAVNARTLAIGRELPSPQAIANVAMPQNSPRPIANTRCMLGSWATDPILTKSRYCFSHSIVRDESAGAVI